MPTSYRLLLRYSCSFGIAVSVDVNGSGLSGGACCSTQDAGKDPARLALIGVTAHVRQQITLTVTASRFGSPNWQVGYS